jgi:adenosylmethionine-8-amino-7-oxononanoate transaminase
MNSYDQLQELDKRHLWHPFTQMKDYAARDLLLIDRAEGLMLYDLKGREYFDTISSWWCIVHGHNHPRIRQAITAQLDKLEHVLLAGAGHPPAIHLAQRLVQLTPAPLNKVFYSDNGSTACEIAVKMSLQYWQHSGQQQRATFVGVERGYHGDTIGTMSLGGTPGFHNAFASLMFPSYRIPSPYCYRCPFDRQAGSCSLACIEPFIRLLEEKGESIAGIILEPLIQAAGGMIIYPPAYLGKIAQLAKEYGIHLILDEVATGFGRTGKMFALEHAEVIPDFLCLSKGLTGGALPMAATLTTDEVYYAFYDDYEQNRTFYHGHTFTGNPLAAAAALGSLQVFEEEQSLGRLAETIPLLHGKMRLFADLPWVGDVRCLGTIAALELVKNKKSKEPFGFEERIGWRIYLRGLQKGLILRPLGNVVYLWLPLSATSQEIEEITARAGEVLGDGELFRPST